VTIAGLAQWAEKSTSKLGIARTETILDFSELMGVLPAGLRTILNKLINVETNANPDSSYSRSYLDSGTSNACAPFAPYDPSVLTCARESMLHSANRDEPFRQRYLPPLSLAETGAKAYSSRCAGQQWSAADSTAPDCTNWPFTPIPAKDKI
jgi:hypothetical protein